MNNRLSRLREELARKEIGAFLVSQPENRYYLSGFDGSAGYLLITADRAVLATDFRYVEQAKNQAPGFTIFKMTGEMGKWLPELANDCKEEKIGFEAGDITFKTYRQMSQILKGQGTGLVPLEGLVESLRAVKETGEFEFITRAAEIADRAFEHIADTIQPGMTEKDAAWAVEKFLRENGSQRLPFTIIVASGPNAALPHATPTDRAIGKGEPVVIDLGARCGGYCSDLTRTICLGSPDETFRKVYDIVLGAQLTALAIIKEGITGEEADSLARTVIAEAGYGEAFGHALGHGVGLSPHEMPRLGPAAQDKIVSGTVFTVEPGIYLPVWGGVRIEDLACMEDSKVKIISKARKV
ncbi:M24 family metallopeptidase [Chloroflexota bacterium]